MSARSVLDQWWAAFNAHDFEALFSLADPDIEVVPLHATLTSPPGTRYHGYDGLKSLFLPGYERFPALRIEGGAVRDVDGRLLADVNLILDDGRGTPDSRLTACFYEISAGCVRRIVAYEPDALPATRSLGLSPREYEVLILLADGSSVHEIAERLFISPLTVRTHVRNAKTKLGARTTAHAVALALRSAADDGA